MLARCKAESQPSPDAPHPSTCTETSSASANPEDVLETIRTVSQPENVGDQLSRAPTIRTKRSGEQRIVDRATMIIGAR